MCIRGPGTFLGEELLAYGYRISNHCYIVNVFYLSNSCKLSLFKINPWKGAKRTRKDVSTYGYNLLA